LARYIIEELPAFKTLCLNIWGEESRIGSREFAMVLWKEGVKIVVSWDWWSGETEEYTDVEEFLRGIDNGVVARRPAWRDGGEVSVPDSTKRPEGASDSEEESVSRASSHSSHRSDRSGTIIWQEKAGPEDNDEGDEMEREYVNEDDTGSGITEQHQANDLTAESLSRHEGSSGGELEVPISAVESMDSGWSDAILTPVSPETEHRHEEVNWEVL
jgi:hypothetical protein